MGREKAHGTGNWETKGFLVSEPQLPGAAGPGHVSGCSPWCPQPRRADSCDSERSLSELAASSMPNGTLLLCPGGRLCFSNVLLLFTFSPSSPPSSRTPPGLDPSSSSPSVCPTALVALAGPPASNSSPPYAAPTPAAAPHLPPTPLWPGPRAGCWEVRSTASIPGALPGS